MTELGKLNRKVQVYDNPSTWDCYTVLIMRKDKGHNVIDVYGMSENATSPDGFNQYSITVNIIDELPTLGTRVSLLDIPPAVLQAIKDRV